MAKAINWNNFNNQFGESFVRTLSQERLIRQRQEEFNREMQFKNRQFDFLSNIQTQKLEMDRQSELSTMYRSGFTPDTETPDVKLFGQGLDYPAPPPEKPQTQAETYYKDGNLLERKFIGEGEDKIITDINMLKGFTPPKGTEEEEKTPYYDLTKSGKAFNEYKELQSGVPVEGGFNLFIGDKPTTLKQTDLEGLKKQKIKDIESTTDNEARQINAKVPGFYSTYQALLKVLENNPKDIDKVVNEYLGKASTETRDAIKTLLRRRIF